MPGTQKLSENTDKYAKKWQRLLDLMWRFINQIVLCSSSDCKSDKLPLTKQVEESLVEEIIFGVLCGHQDFLKHIKRGNSEKQGVFKGKRQQFYTLMCIYRIHGQSHIEFCDVTQWVSCIVGNVGTRFWKAKQSTGPAAETLCVTGFHSTHLPSFFKTSPYITHNST